METKELLDALERDGVLLADAAERAGLDAEVPSCPGWGVRELLTHTGRVHCWATGFVAEGLTRGARLPAEPAVDGPELVAWFRAGHRALVHTLTTAPADTSCWSFLPAPSPLAFWIRRQAHETAVHRADAELARGGPLTPTAPDFAVDGIDELLFGFHGRDRSQVRTDLPRVLRLRATDAGAVWTVRLSAEVPRVARDDDGAADCEVSGPAAELYLALWNRLPITDLATAGDQDLVRLWRERSAI